MAAIIEIEDLKKLLKKAMEKYTINNTCMVDILEWATCETDLLDIKLKATKKKARFLEDSIGEERLIVGDLRNKLTMGKVKTRAIEGKIKKVGGQNYP